MTIDHFNSLDNIEKYNVTLTYGEFLCARIDEDKKYLLYALGNFFVEQKWDYVNKRMLGFASFADGELLDTYRNLSL